MNVSNTNNLLVSSIIKIIYYADDILVSIITYACQTCLTIKKNPFLYNSIYWLKYCRKI